jgi:hypothetical protein
MTQLPKKRLSTNQKISLALPILLSLLGATGYLLVNRPIVDYHLNAQEYFYYWNENVTFEITPLTINRGGADAHVFVVLEVKNATIISSEKPYVQGNSSVVRIAWLLRSHSEEEKVEPIRVKPLSKKPFTVTITLEARQPSSGSGIAAVSQIFLEANPVYPIELTYRLDNGGFYRQGR